MIARFFLVIAAAVMFLIAFTGCAAVKIGALSTLASVSSGRADSAVALMKIDSVKQKDFRARSKTVTTVDDLNKLEAEFHAWQESRNKGLLGLDASGDVIEAVRKRIMSGNYDLAALLDAWRDLKALLTKLGVQVPALPGGL